MTTINPDMRAKVLAALYAIVPEAEDEDVRDDLAIRDQFDMDSVDFLNFVIRLHEVFKIEIPESDYKLLGNVGSIAAYLSSRVK